jgi:sulfite exporter TauE/SafE
MLILGVNLLDLFPFLAKFQLRMPRSFTDKIIKNNNLKNKLAPLILGAATFFLPCGFTQSMQISSMASGNFWDGALIMLVFAAGTLPVLAVVSFTSISFANKSYSSVFYKTAGFIIMFFAIFNFINALVPMGIISPVF